MKHILILVAVLLASHPFTLGVPVPVAEVFPFVVRRTEMPMHAEASTSSPADKDEATAADAAPLRIATVLQTPTAAVLFDPEATWTAPMIPSGMFKPMPHIVEQQQQGAAVSTSSEDVKKPNDVVANGAAQVNVTDHAGSGPSATPVAVDAVKANVTVAADKSAETIGGLKPASAEKIQQITEAISKAEQSIKLSSANTTQPAKDNVSHPVRRSFRWNDGTSTGMLRKRSLFKREEAPAKIGVAASSTTTKACDADDRETLVPVTYNELELIKAGLLKLAPIDPLPFATLSKNATSESSKEFVHSAPSTNTTVTREDCAAQIMRTVVMVPVSEMQMMGILSNALKVKATQQSGVVMLITPQEDKMYATVTSSSSSNEGSAQAAAADEPGPMFDVVPVSKADDNASKTNKPPVANAIATDGTPTSDHSAAPKPTRRSEIADMIAHHLDRRQQPSKASNTSLVGNGQGKLKYGHKIHHNAALLSAHVPLPALMLVVVGIFACWL